MATGTEGQYSGFNVYAGAELVAPIRFTSTGLMLAQGLSVRRTRPVSEMSFTGLYGVPESGITLGASAISVKLTPGSFPRVRFDIRLKTFDLYRWQNAVGMQPFHFLTIRMPEADVWQEGGWLNATPRADLFPLLLDVHQGSPELSSYPFNREWSTLPPLSGMPLPVIGLWAPQQHLYAAWDFEQTRLTSNSERDLAAGFCNRPVLPVALGERFLPPTDSLVEGPAAELGDLTPVQRAQRAADRAGRSKFVAMVYPHGGAGYQHLVYPAVPIRLRSAANFVFSTTLGPEKDPNRLLWHTWWTDIRLRDLLPRAPAAADLSWIGPAGHLQKLPEPASGTLLAGVEGSFQTPGSELISGWDSQDELPIRLIVRSHDSARLHAVEREATVLVSTARSFTADGDRCVYWDKPLKGRWTDGWGGPAVTTLHNANGFAAARLLLELARCNHQPEYLPLVDGALNWARHVVWMRNEFADVPSSPFAIGSTLAVSFLLEYYNDFKYDRARQRRAGEALELAHSFIYRTMAMWAGDARRDDGLMSGFLWEPNSGRDWTGAACSNEVIWCLDSEAQVAVATGDPVLLWALEGTLSRWYELYQATYHESLSSYGPADFTEGFGIAPDNIYGYPAGRARYGFGGALTLLDPIGDSAMRVVAGRKAALAFARGGADVRLTDYRCTGDGKFAFTLGGSAGPVDVTVTFPYASIQNNEVQVRRMAGGTPVAVNVDRAPYSDWSIVVRRVRPGDMVIVGHPDLRHAQPLPCSPALTLRSAPEPAAAFAPFVPVPMRSVAQLDASWSVRGFAGLWTGVHWVDDVPFGLPEGSLPALAGSSALQAPASAGAVFLLYAPGGDMLALPTVRTDHGSATPILPRPGLAWQAWPERRGAELLVAGYTAPAGARITGVDMGGARLVAATALPGPDCASPRLGQIRADLTASAERLRARAELLQQVSALRASVVGFPAAGTVVLPPESDGSEAMDLLQMAGLGQQIRRLSADEVADPGVFNARTCRIALFVDGEAYVRSVHSPGDAAEAVVSFVRQGGTLILMGSQPYPMYYAIDAGLGGRAVSPLLAQLGMPLENSIEQAPESRPAVQEAAGQNVLTGVPRSFAYPDGDPRLRTVDTASLPAGADYQPIYRVISRDGHDYGDAAALLTLPAEGSPKRGQILYVSNVLLQDPSAAPAIVEAVMRWAARAAGR